MRRESSIDKTFGLFRPRPPFPLVVVIAFAARTHGAIHFPIMRQENRILASPAESRHTDEYICGFCIAAQGLKPRDDTGIDDGVAVEEKECDGTGGEPENVEWFGEEGEETGRCKGICGSELGGRSTVACR